MSKNNRSFAEQFYLQDASLKHRLGRDLRLLLWMAQTVRVWFKGRTVRAKFEQARAEHQPFFVDGFAGPPVAVSAVKPEVVDP